MERGTGAGRGDRPGALSIFRCVLILLVMATPTGVEAFDEPGESGDPQAPKGAPRLTIGDVTRPAAEKSPGDPDAPGQASLLGDYFRMLGWLVLVVAVIIGGLYALRRYWPGAPTERERSLVSVVGRAALSPRQQVAVVRVGERALVLGVSPDRIEKLCELVDSREVLALSGATFESELSRESAYYGPYDEPQIDEEHAAESSAANLEPYRREIERLKALVGNWRYASTPSEDE